MQCPIQSLEKYLFEFLARPLTSQYKNSFTMLQDCEENVLIPGASFPPAPPFPSLFSIQMDKKKYMRVSAPFPVCLSLHLHVYPHLVDACCIACV